MALQSSRLLVLFGDQLFPREQIAALDIAAVFMAEADSICRRYAAHRHKLVLILSAMRSKADAYRLAGQRVFYRELGPSAHTFSTMLSEHLETHPYEELVHFETESPRITRMLDKLAEAHGLTRTVYPSPKFMTPRTELRRFRATHKRLFMKDFYRWQRKRLGILLDRKGAPVGGRWSFDEENRKKLPRGLTPPGVLLPSWTEHTKRVVELVDTHFTSHPGRASEFWLPTTDAQAEQALQSFLRERFRSFGDYEDALSQTHATLFHSILSPLLNIGLLTPSHVIDRALAYAADANIPINSLEGFVRQIIGWREFVRAVWVELPSSHWHQNYWNHERRLTSHWYNGTTGIPPLDDAIVRANATGYNHHIERLMVLGNLMLLCRVDPQAAYRWFMEMYVDAADWVMAPNLYGMALFSEGGAFTTKPYICGSNYLRKMSDYTKGSWCDTVDGLYWSFVDTHRAFFAKNPRSKMLLASLERMDGARKHRIFSRAEAFIERVTE